jgi:hypothetical protein
MGLIGIIHNRTGYLIITIMGRTHIVKHNIEDAFQNEINALIS